jgi:hypothetical protein
MAGARYLITERAAALRLAYDQSMSGQVFDGGPALFMKIICGSQLLRARAIFLFRFVWPLRGAWFHEEI